jgi:hypothetical protein
VTKRLHRKGTDIRISPNPVRQGRRKVWQLNALSEPIYSEAFPVCPLARSFAVRVLPLLY